MTANDAPLKITLTTALSGNWDDVKACKIVVSPDAPISTKPRSQAHRLRRYTPNAIPSMQSPYAPIVRRSPCEEKWLVTVCPGLARHEEIPEMADQIHIAPIKSRNIVARRSAVGRADAESGADAVGGDRSDA